MWENSKVHVCSLQIFLLSKNMLVIQVICKKVSTDIWEVNYCRILTPQRPGNVRVTFYPFSGFFQYSYNILAGHSLWSDLHSRLARMLKMRNDLKLMLKFSSAEVTESLASQYLYFSSCILTWMISLVLELQTKNKLRNSPGNFANSL